MVKFDTRAAASDSSGTFTFAPAGRYRVEIPIGGAKLKTTKDERPMFELRLKILEPAEHRGKLACFDRLIMRGKGTGITKRRLEALGFDTRNPEIDVQAADFIGRSVWITTVVETYNGKPNTKVDLGASEWCGYEPDGTSAIGSPEDDAESPSDEDETPF